METYKKQKHRYHLCLFLFINDVDLKTTNRNYYRKSFWIAKNLPFLKHQLCLLILTKFIKCRNFTKYSSDNVFLEELL